jgi:hypothetical protein
MAMDSKYIVIVVSSSGYWWNKSVQVVNGTTGGDCLSLYKRAAY